MAKRRAFTPEEKQAYIESKQRERDELETRVRNLVDSFRDSDTFKTYLSQMSEFNRRCDQYLHHYSPNNVLFIMMQDPTAQMVGAAHAWRKMGRYIKKGEHSHIQVWAPIREAVMRDKLDENGQPILDTNGKPVREPERDENGRVKRRFAGRFKLEPVFDISQTDGEPLPELAHELKNPVEHFTDYEKALREISPFPIYYSNEKEVVDLPLRGAKGLCSYLDRKIVVKAGMSNEQTLKTMIHEITHAKLHDPTKLKAELGKDALGLSRQEKEVQAECTAYVVCNHFGFDTSDYSIPYIMSWGEDKKLTPLTKSLDVILQASNEIITQMETRLWVEMGIDETLKDVNLEPPRSSSPLIPAAFNPSMTIDVNRIMANKTVSALHDQGFKLRLNETPLQPAEPPLITLQKESDRGVVRIEARLFYSPDGYALPNFDSPKTTTLIAFERGQAEPAFVDNRGNLVDQFRELSRQYDMEPKSAERKMEPLAHSPETTQASSRSSFHTDAARRLLSDQRVIVLRQAGYQAEAQKIMTPSGAVDGLSLVNENDLYGIKVEVIPPFTPLDGHAAVNIAYPETTSLTAYSKANGTPMTFFEARFDASLPEQMDALRNNPEYQYLRAEARSGRKHVQTQEAVQDPIASLKKRQAERSAIEGPQSLASRSMNKHNKRDVVLER